MTFDWFPETINKSLFWAKAILMLTNSAAAAKITNLSGTITYKSVKNIIASGKHGKCKHRPHVSGIQCTDILSYLISMY